MAKSAHTKGTKKVAKLHLVDPVVPVPEPVVERPTLIELHLEEKVELRKLEQAIIDRKMNLADLVVQFELDKARMLLEVQKAANAHLSLARATLKTHGIEPLPTEQWNLDTTKMVFNRLK